jgi:phosphotransferase system HPr (HPr) family protein
MAETTLLVTHKVGLHARPASLFVQTAKKFVSAITVQDLSTGSKIVNAKSIIHILSLGVQQGHEIQLQATGADAEEAIQSLQALVQSNFGEV